MRKEKLDQVIEMIEITKNILTEDIGITVWDLDGTVIYASQHKSLAATIDVGFKCEDRNDPLFTVMSTGKSMYHEIPKEVFGFSVKGKLVPVYDEGKIVGCIASATKKSDEKEFKEKNQVIEEIHASIDNLEKSVNGVYGVVESIKKNTSNIKMLALNASIEAARAGEYGRGFTIVAHEMGKLSQMSSESVAGINDTLNDISKSIKETTELINKI